MLCRERAIMNTSENQKYKFELVYVMAKCYS